MEILFWIIGFSAVLYFATIITKFFLKLKKEITTLLPKIDTEITTPIPKKKYTRTENCRRCGGLFEASSGMAAIQDSAARARYWQSTHTCDKCVRKIS